MRAVVGLALLLVSCGGGQEAPEELAFDFDSPAPLTALPPCDEPPPPSGDEPAEGMVLPDGSVILGVIEQGPLTTATGYVARTPIGIRLDYEAQEGIGVELLVVEDEVFEVELLLTTGEHRMFLKGRAVCDEGTQFQAVLAPEVEGEMLPEPAGTEPAGVPGS